MHAFGTAPQRAAGAGAPLPFRTTSSAGSQRVLLSGVVPVLTGVFQGSPDVVGLLTAPSPAAGIWLLKGNFSRVQTSHKNSCLGNSASEAPSLELWL